MHDVMPVCFHFENNYFYIYFYIAFTSLLHRCYYFAHGKLFRTKFGTYATIYVVAAIG